MNITAAKPEECRLLSSIAYEAKAHWGYPRAWLEVWQPELTVTIADLDTNLFFAARIENQVAGFYALEMAGTAASLEHFWVRPPYIGQGVGRALFEHAVQEAAGCGAGKLRIVSDPNAEGFYQRMGAVCVGTEQGQVLGEIRRLPVLELQLNTD